MSTPKAITVDLGGTHIRCATVDYQGNISQLQKEKSEIHKGYKYVINKMISMIRKQTAFDEVNLIGIGCPGPLSAKKGVVYAPPNLSDWDQVPLTAIIQKEVNKQVCLENDANVAALGEATFGSGRGYQICQYITISTGVGGGIVINGKLVSGQHNCAGEVGNIIIRDNGSEVKALNKGSFEGEASGRSLMIRANRAGLSVHDAEAVFTLYQEGSPAAMRVVQDYAHDIARGMATIAQVIDPDVFILGGGVMNAFAILEPLILKYYPSYVYPVMGEVQIKQASLEEPGIVGAAFLANN
ncbi:glucokinase [Amphibacillus marinus]|uniref:Glucokinase n=1 Tax=Amphibacillus marinus TaxID=872970 RepID=A0A1H8KEW4_9BACI|nr:ROK family protein [Amphibacillus marinus]SEN91424.1 glucokinase [Amphibacillus marinus]